MKMTTAQPNKACSMLTWEEWAAIVAAPTRPTA